MDHEWMQAMRVSGYFDEILEGFVWRDHLIQSSRIWLGVRVISPVECLLASLVERVYYSG